MFSHPESPPLIVRALRRIAREGSRASERISSLLWWHGQSGRTTTASLRAMRGRYQGRRAFVFGGGPSLLRTDVRLLRNEVTIGSNTLFLLFAEMGYLPSFYTVEDRLVAEDRAGVINSIQGTTKVVPWDLRGVIRQDASTLYVNFIRDYRNGPLFSDDFAGRVYWGGTVTFLNLQLAYHLGCDPVYLIGFDHGYSVPQEDVTSGTASAERGQNHFHKDSYGPGFRWNDPQFDRMERAYRVAKRHFEAEGRSILNATDGGRLEVFQRVDFTEVLKRDY